MEINRLLAAVVILFAAFIIYGWKKGFLRIVISFAGTLIVLIAVIFVSPKVSEYIMKNTDLYEKTREKVTAAFVEKLTDKDTDTTEEDIKGLDVPDIMKNDLIEKNATGMYQALLVSVFKEFVAGYLSRLVINAGSFVGVYIILTIAKWILVKSSDIISRIPVIKGINSLFGACIGAMDALIIVWVVFFIIIMFLGEDIGGRLLASVQKSWFLTYLFNKNLLFRFISGR
ncbi:MAG: CvpA family protein [Lachnospiraceae bacterium]|nr:CvpA family protein [Lachnospiraceae bacterium]